MKRFPAFDPPEYLDWSRDPEVMAQYSSCIEEDADLKRRVAELETKDFEQLYRSLIRSRLYDITLKRWVRTGVLTKAWLGVGEEAVTVGALFALASDDPVGPMIRNQAAAFEKGISLADCFKVYLATGDTITQGRDLHIGDVDHHVVSPISHVGDLVPVMAGYALSFQIRGEARVALTWCGEGATRTGAFHEGLALAAQLRLPLIVVVQDNQVALGTRKEERFERALRSTAKSHGVPGLECEGNHVLDVFGTIAQARELCLGGEGPVVVYTRTFRMGGHATHDEREARELFDSSEFAYWGKRDPIGCFEEYLVESVGVDRSALETWEAEVNQEVETAAREAQDSSVQFPPEPEALLNS